MSPHRTDHTRTANPPHARSGLPRDTATPATPNSGKNPRALSHRRPAACRLALRTDHEPMAAPRPLPPRIEPPPRQDAPRARPPSDRGIQRPRRPRPRPDVRDRHNTRGVDPRRPPSSRDRARAQMGNTRSREHRARPTPGCALVRAGHRRRRTPSPPTPRHPSAGIRPRRSDPHLAALRLRGRGRIHREPRQRRRADPPRGHQQLQHRQDQPRTRSRARLHRRYGGGVRSVRDRAEARRVPCARDQGHALRRDVAQPERRHDHALREPRV